MKFEILVHLEILVLSSLNLFENNYNFEIMNSFIPKKIRALVTRITNAHFFFGITNTHY
jgi:hypothetical protein